MNMRDTSMAEIAALKITLSTLTDKKEKVVIQCSLY